MNKILPVFLIKENFRRPKAAEIVTAEIDKPLLGEIYQIVGFPHTQFLAACVIYCTPIHTVLLIHTACYAQIGGKYYKTARVKSYDFNITAAPFPHCACKYGIALVNLLPIIAVTAFCEVNLLAVGSDFFLKMYAKIRHNQSPVISFLIKKSYKEFTIKNIV